ncbi:MAG: hypothetical protein HRT87_07730 [Legionellales bacterium]|nr:hypothetical protein [Legionellales bacterium]
MNNGNICRCLKLLVLFCCVLFSINANSDIYSIKNTTSKPLKIELLVRYFDKTYSKEYIKNLQIEVPANCYIENITSLVEDALNKLNIQFNDLIFTQTDEDEFVPVKNIDNKIKILDACLSGENSNFNFTELFGLLTISDCNNS